MRRLVTTAVYVGFSSPGSQRPAASADELAPEREWDIQVATVGVTPVEPPTGLSLLGRRCHARSAAGLAAKASSRRTIPKSHRGHLKEADADKGIGLL